MLFECYKLFHVKSNYKVYKEEVLENVEYMEKISHPHIHYTIMDF